MNREATERKRQRDLKTLDYWRARLLGLATGDEPTAAAPDTLPPVNLKDPASVVRRLDALQTLVGRAAVKLTLPPPLARAQQAAQQAAAQLVAAQNRLQHATLQTAVSQSEKIRARAELARAQTDVELAHKQEEFTHLVLGRDCVAADHHVPAEERHVAEIRELRRHMAR